ncbi:terminase large subunit domain-containing protein [Enterococcus faecalis]|uniref:terminase large subunit domain-containing protein n=1 Tax=Enterococcus faecalis TaxID=1351 RepID=UPI003CC54958
MLSNKYVEAYFSMWEQGKIQLNKERIQLINYLKEKVLCRNDLYFDEKQIEQYIAFSEKNYFEIDPWEKFIVPFIFLYFKDTNEVFFERFFITLGRGGGKNGFISTLCNYFISPLHGINNYDVTIVANSEDQAKRSFDECFNKIDASETLRRHFKHGRSKIIGKKTNSVFRFATSNAKTKDGGREGCVIYDEIHEMVNSAIVDVFSGGLGKVDNPREFFISTNGFVREGYYDLLMESCIEVLEGKSSERIFPFICKLDNIKEMDNEEMWEKANPALCKPLTKRAERLLRKIRSQYEALLKAPSGRRAFVTKRMNLIEGNEEKDVTTIEKLKATNRTYTIASGQSCVAGFDYASIRDFASVGLLFEVDGNFVWKQHSFARKQFLDTFKLKAPIKEWEREGLITIVDEPSIDPQHLVDWLNEQRLMYSIELVCADGFRMDLLKPLLEKNDYQYEFLRNPRGVQAKIAPIIEDGFANERFIFGDDPLMRWYTNNTYIKEDGQGNRTFLKKEPVRRKTDGFHAFLAALYKRDWINESVDYKSAFDMLDELEF